MYTSDSCPMERQGTELIKDAAELRSQGGELPVQLGRSAKHNGLSWLASSEMRSQHTKFYVQCSNHSLGKISCHAYRRAHTGEKLFKM
ncbi:hypothetical protein AVEN_68157-2 [Araneus ventricosus]|uniref:Uncharacterized protein n=1 Tax=Araneus ventricosus TaxID=182803 RepID=A0A4Y2MUG0_ARAVE|nr:hypothetical protein AVEN_68157-2 [Araneus ventricosus]